MDTSKRKARALLTKWKLPSWKRQGNTLAQLESRLLTGKRAKT